MQGIYSQRKEIREALLTCFTSDDIKELLLNLYEIANQKENKPSDRIKASQVILDYSVGKIRNYNIDDETETKIIIQREFLDEPILNNE